MSADRQDNAAPPVPASAGNIARAAEILRRGGLVAFPTETVYGLGADATDDRAVAAIFEAKGRPKFNPLIVHVPDAAAAFELGVATDTACKLAADYWPGPLTLVMQRVAACPVSLLASAGLDSLAVRVPRHPIAQALLRAAGRPLAAPSANRSGKISPTTAQHVADSLGRRVELILDGGACPVGIESTVVDVSGPSPALLRHGGVTQEDIEAVIGKLATATSSAAPKSPGQLESHYAPALPLRLDARDAKPDEALLAFGPEIPPGARVTANLSPSGYLVEAAANLFAMLRRLDGSGCRAIAVMPVPDTGLGRAINDRLRRAAAR
ncbi:MAG TPA: L-threonylcarbamoyladenylate synthase [Verrucomicrobiae bacterium]|nr:L-threonylcarbamoyladenylate synthase [Verrucomicrobiae bacterium]